VEPARGLDHLEPPAHPALVSEAGFIAAQDITAGRGPAGPAARRYLLAGLLACGQCGRRLESSWSNGRPAYRCRHGYTSATSPSPPGRGTMQITTPGGTACLIDQLRTAGVILIYDAGIRTIRTGDSHPIAVTTAAAR
jgi:hypothetical protein